MERSAQHHVLDRQRRDDGVVGLQHAGRDHEGLGIHQAGGDAARDDVQVAIEEGDVIELAFVIEVDELELLLAVLGGQSGILEIGIGLFGVASRGFGDDHGPLEALGEVVQDSAHAVGMAGGQLIGGVDEVRLDDHVLLALHLRLEVFVDRFQSGIDVLAALVAVRDRHRGTMVGHREWFRMAAEIRGVASCRRGLFGGGLRLLRACQTASQERGRASQLKETPSIYTVRHVNSPCRGTHPVGRGCLYREYQS